MGALCILGGVLCLALAGWNVAMYIILVRCPHLTVKTGAWREETEHRKNRRIWFGVSDSKFVKDTTLACYRYEVNGCSYYFKLKHLFEKPSETSYMVPIVYVKRFPWVHMVNFSFWTTEAFVNRAIKTSICITAAMLLFFIGGQLL